MPQIRSFPGELWGYGAMMPDILSIDFLLPNGLLITLECSRDSTLNDAKRNLWNEASKYPLFDSLSLPPSSYIFESVTQEAKKLEYYDEKKRICDLKLFHPFFKLNEQHSDIKERVERSLNSEINKAIGLYSNEIESIRDEEIVNFRLNLLNFLNENVLQKKLYLTFESVYSPNLELESSLLDTSVNNAAESFNQVTLGTNNKSFEVKIHVIEFEKGTNQELPRQTYSLVVECKQSPSDVIVMIIRLKLSDKDEKAINENVRLYKDYYMLSVCGCKEYLFGNKFPLVSYKYVKECLNTGKIPNFRLEKVENVDKLLPKETNSLKLFIEKEKTRHLEYLKEIENNELQNTPELSWNVTKNFLIHIISAAYMPSLKDCDKLFFKLAIYHGQETVSQDRHSSHVDYTSLKWFQTIDFNVQVRNLHRCSKLCVALYCQSKRKKESFPLGFISINIFDYKGCLVSGKKKLYLWQISPDSFTNLCTGEVTGQNPNKNFIEIDVEFNSSLNPQQFKQYSNVIYPSVDVIKKLVKTTSDKSQDECFDCDNTLENDNTLLKDILRKDALDELTEQDKTIMWRRRLDCLSYPNSLPKLLQSVKWTSKDDIIEIYHLLQKWPNVKPVVAIELLHAVHADIEVRKFAVNSLNLSMKNEEIQQYLLQLVQSLKNEPYYDNALTRFLLERAFKSQRVGFDLFWHLKSEIKNEKYKYRFGLILEIYCRGISGLIKNISKQVEVVEKLSILAENVKENRDDLSILKGQFLQLILDKQDYNEALSNFISPLNRSHHYGSIDSNKCKILSSAKRPLYLTWKNTEYFAELYENSFELIFKHGDDLRQDMLTLQILKLMDVIWKSDGLDLKMVIYQVFSTGYHTGFIQVIKNAKTLFKIQMDGGMRGRYQIDNKQLYNWISLNNSSPQKLSRAVDFFTKSCAAYCVATYILGIGDRHPDNIMVNKDGQIFHIDYGHFLGNFKRKFGILRERVPFVLTDDFVCVITRGSSKPLETKEFENFRSLCENAYMIVRRHAHLIINLFTLMLSSDMPELQSIEDIMYLRKTLALDETDQNAREFFRKQLYESYTHSYTTKFDWMFHALNRKNLL